MSRQQRAKPESRPSRGAALAQMRALAHPLRLRILELFADQPRTTKQVAEFLGEPPTRLYHHVAALERAGLLRLVETRKKRGTVERWYEAAARTLENVVISRKAARKPTESAARRAVAMAVLEQSRQEVVAAMHRSGEEPAAITRLVIVAPRARVAELRRRLSELVAEIQRDFGIEQGEALPADQERWALTMTFTPILPRQRT
jgi:DNA-binding transcriptional ArsR family regulator